MYANIFSDIEIDERRMKKRTANNSSIQELVEEKVVILETKSTPSAPSAPKYSETRTTTVFTPGNNKMQQAMGVKMVADELLAATGTVIGGTAGLFLAARSGNPRNVLTGIKTGEAVGRVLGSWMWSAING
jgi:hypothetical protein